MPPICDLTNYEAPTFLESVLKYLSVVVELLVYANGVLGN